MAPLLCHLAQSQNKRLLCIDPPCSHCMVMMPETVENKKPLGAFLLFRNIQRLEGGIFGLVSGPNIPFFPKMLGGGSGGIGRGFGGID